MFPIIYYLHLGAINPHYNLNALILMFIGALTDTLDGQLARRLHQVTEVGKIIDPIADKIGIAVILIYLAMTRGDFPIWFVLFAFSRDTVIFVIGIYVKKKYNYIFMSNMLGKATVTAMAITILIYTVKDLYHLEIFFRFCLWSSVVLLIASSVSYALRLVSFIGEQRA